MPRPLRLPLLTVAVLLAFGGGSALAAGWVAQTGALNGTHAAISESRVAVDGAGNLYAAWLEGNQLEVAKRTVGGGFEQPQTINTGGSTPETLDIGVDGLGNALLLWQSGTTMFESRRSAGSPAGSFESTGARISNASATLVGPPRLAVSNAGDAVIAFRDEQGGGSTKRINVGLGTASGGLPIDTGQVHYTEDTPHDPSVAINDAGDAAVVWDAIAGTFAPVPSIRAVYRVHGAAFPSGTPETVSGGASAVFDPSVDVDSAGHAVAMWVEGTSNSVVRASTRPSGAGQAWAAPSQAVDTPGQAASEPRVAFDAVGGASAIWSGNRELRGATMPAGGAFGAVQTLAPANEDASGIQFDSGSPIGAAAGVWSSGDPGPVRALARPSGGTFGSISTLSPSGHTGAFPDVAADPLGNAAAVWADSSAGSPPQLLAAEYDATAPTLIGPQAPDSLTVGEAGSFTGASSDDWTTPAITWDFGDGSGGSGNDLTHTYSAAGSYAVSAIAVDGAGNTSVPFTKTVTVAPVSQPPPPPPIVEQPTLGVDFNASSVKGKVLVSVPKGAPAGRVLARRPVARSAAAIKPPPGYSPFRLLGKDDNIPVGAILDATNGTSAITMATNKAGTATQTGQFSQGVYKTKQSKKSRLTTAVLLGGGNFVKGCRAPKTRGAAAARRRPGRRLFANVHGRFRTRGRHSTATVRGTKFLTKDTCNGTTTIVLRGVVVVRDLAKHRNHTLRAGQRFTARPRQLRRAR